MAPNEPGTKSAAELRVAVVQTRSTDNRDQNLAELDRVLSQMSDVDLISFPENCLYMRLRDGEVIPTFRLNDSCFDQIQRQAVRLGALIHLGSVPLSMDGESRPFNSSVLFFPDGHREAAYQKMHLFDVDVKGHPPVRESDNFARGCRPAVVDFRGWRLGLSICYDLRFSPLYAYYQSQNVDVVLIPAAFLVPTGRAHWEVLIRARAIETQAYVLAAAQGGSHRGLRETYGHSMIVNPWGEVICSAQTDPTALRAKLQKTEIAKVRTQIPMSAHRHSWNLV